MKTKKTLSKAEIAEIESLDELYAAMVDGRIEEEDWIELPVFGGEEPDSKHHPFWSWDSERIIIGECERDLEIITRKTLGDDK